MAKKKVGPPQSIEELAELWENPALDVDEKLLRTFSGLQFPTDSDTKVLEELARKEGAKMKKVN